MPTATDYKPKLFYSYSHHDSHHRTALEKSLDLLKQQNFLDDWSDNKILPGQSLSKEITENIDSADIVVFLLSQNFIASPECMKEWHRVKDRARKDSYIFRVPIILEDCAWPDLLKSDDVKALPNDATSISSFDNASTGWQQVYEGIKSITTELNSTFTPRSEFLESMERTDFLSNCRLALSELFVFPKLSSISSQTSSGRFVEEFVINEEQLFERKRLLVHGAELSGKTALGRFLFLRLIAKEKPVLYIDLKESPKRPWRRVLRDTFHKEFSGNFSVWESRTEKTLILDNLSMEPTTIEFLVACSDYFSTIIVTTPSDVFWSFFKDDERLLDYDVLRIEPMSHVQQENLIRSRSALFESENEVMDGTIDQIEDRVNSIIISHKIVPRYPFFVLSILQTYEAYMPDNLSISSYGHCYHALIVAMLIKAGVRQSDSDINTCFNFAEHLAYENYIQSGDTDELGARRFDAFLNEYDERFILPRAVLNRMRNREYGILTPDGGFRSSYMQYFFLGRYFAKNAKNSAKDIEKICEEGHVGSNHLILLFVIHHTNDDELIDDIMVRTMCSLDQFKPATLDANETRRFSGVLSKVKREISCRIKA